MGIVLLTLACECVSAAGNVLIVSLMLRAMADAHEAGRRERRAPAAEAPPAASPGEASVSAQHDPDAPAA